MTSKCNVAFWIGPWNYKRTLRKKTEEIQIKSIVQLKGIYQHCFLTFDKFTTLCKMLTLGKTG